VSEIWDRLYEHFQVSDQKEVLDILDIDCAWVDPEVGRRPAERDEEGLIIGWGGSRLSTVYNAFGAYDEIVRYATDGCGTVAEMDRILELPGVDEYDFSGIGLNCEKYADRFLLGGFASTLYYPTLVRRLEDILVDMAVNEDMAHYLFDRCADWHLEYHKRLLKAGGGRIDAMQIGDDFATQIGLLMSPEMFRKYFRKNLIAFVDLAESYGAMPYLHCCGSAYHLIPEFIDIGIRILDPIQTVAKNMEPARLKAEFGDRIAFHGAGETQWILPNGTPDEVRENARMLSRTLGEGGGYIMTSCHYMQSDVPVENVLAFYELENRY
jgi:uroporphyrinogen decarboxylase